MMRLTLTDPPMAILTDRTRSDAHHKIGIGFKLVIRCIKRSRFGHGLRDEQPIK
jgi:hypothetical protein